MRELVEFASKLEDSSVCGERHGVWKKKSVALYIFLVSQIIA